jgi:hypothetical protein
MLPEDCASRVPTSPPPRGPGRPPNPRTRIWLLFLARGTIPRREAPEPYNKNTSIFVQTSTTSRCEASWRGALSAMFDSRVTPDSHRWLPRWRSASLLASRGRLSDGRAGSSTDFSQRIIISVPGQAFRMAGPDFRTTLRVETLRLASKSMAPAGHATGGAGRSPNSEANRHVTALKSGEASCRPILKLIPGC